MTTSGSLGSTIVERPWPKKTKSSPSTSASPSFKCSRSAYVARRWPRTTSRHPVRGLLSAKVPNSSFAEAHKVLLSEPTHMEDEDEDQENEKEDERDGEECKVENRREVRTNTAHEAWMT